MRRFLFVPALVAALAVVLFSGCLADDFGTEGADAGTDADGDGLTDRQEQHLGTDPRDPQTDGKADADRYPPREAYGEPAWREGDVQVEATGDGRYRATREVVVANGLGDAVRGQMDLHTVNGGVAVAGVRAGGYILRADLFAVADSEAEARDRLAELEVVHDDSLSGGTLAVQAEVAVRTEGPSGPVEELLEELTGSGVNTDWSNRGGGLLLLVPDNVPYEAALDTTNGGVVSEGIAGTSLSGHATNGGVAVAGDWDTLDLDTTNGGIVIVGGRHGTGDGSYTASCTNGGIEVTLRAKASQGFDVEGDVTNGGVTIALPNTAPVGEQSRDHKHVRTSGYDQKATRTMMDLDCTNGGIAVVGA